MVSALRLVALLVEYDNERSFRLLWDFPLAPNEGGESVELEQDGSILLKSDFQQFRGKALWPHCFRVCHCLDRCSNLLLRGLDPEGTCDWVLRQPLRDVGIEHVGFSIQQQAEESYSCLTDTPFVAQQSLSLVTDALRFDLLRLLQLHRLIYRENPC